MNNNQNPSLWQRLTGGLRRTASALGTAVTDIVAKRKLDADTIEDLWHRVAESIRLSALAEPGDRVVITGGTRLNLPGSTDHILVRTME